LIKAGVTGNMYSSNSKTMRLAVSSPESISITHSTVAPLILILAFVSGCSSAISSGGFRHRQIKTDYSAVGSGSPLWMKYTVHVDEFTNSGERTSSEKVGFLYCEKADGENPRCLPVEVKPVPAEMTFSPFETVLARVSAPTVPPRVTAAPAPQKAASAPVGDDQNEKQKPTRIEPLKPAAPKASTPPPKPETTVVDFAKVWTPTDVLKVLYPFKNKPIIVYLKKGSTISGDYLDADTSSTIPGPQIVIWSEYTRKLVLINNIDRIAVPVN